VTTLRAYRRLLANGPLARLLAGEFVSSIGDWLYLVALLIVVYQQSRDPILLGVVGAARILPYVVLSVPAGIAADRFDRRLVLLITDIARGLVMLGLAWLVATDGPLLAIVALAILATCFSAFFGPTIGAYLPTLVRDETELGPANSAWATLDNLAFIVGPAIGGLLIAASGLTLAFLLNAVSFAVVTTVLWRLPSPAQPSVAAPSPEGSERDTGVGERSAADVLRASRQILAGIVAIDLVGSFAFGGLGILTVVLATDVYRGGDEATGYLNAAIGVGGLLGAIGSGPLVLRARLGAPLLAGAVVLALGLVGLGLAGDLGPGLAAMTVAAAGSLLVEVVSTTLFQRYVPNEVRGRLLGATATLGHLSYAAGSLVVPPLADRVGVGAALVGLGLLVLVAGLIGVVLIGRKEEVAVEPELARDIARAGELPLFAGVPAARLRSALAAAHRQAVSAGDVVIRQGDVADRFYLIRDGSFVVSQRDGPGDQQTLLRRMGPDEVFGEIGLLTGKPRTATVTAESDGSLLVLDRPDFLELVSAGPGLAPRLLDLHRGATAAPSPRRARRRTRKAVSGS
jgi:MFS family permease